jgi:hypothetical protein
VDILLDEDVDLFAVVSLVRHEKGVYGYNAGVAERGDESAIAIPARATEALAKLW